MKSSSVFPLALASLALAALALSSPADALRRSVDGSGQAVLVPYYSVRDNRSTLLSIVNHADAPKAVRFVIAEGRNGRKVLTLIYIAARDTWTGALVQDYAGARLLSADGTCSVPALPPAGVQLGGFLYRSVYEDGLGNDSARLAEGQLEVIEMGELTGAAADAAQNRQCNALVGRFYGDGVWAIAPNTDVSRPSG